MALLRRAPPSDEALYNPTVLRLRRWLLAASTLLSLAVWLAAVTFWYVDRHTTTSRELMAIVPRVSHTGHGVAYGLFVCDGHVFAARLLAPGGPADAWHVRCGTDHRWSMSFYCLGFLDQRGGIWRHLGDFGYTTFGGRPPYELFYGATILMLPLGLVLAALSVLPTAWAYGVIQRRRRRMRPGHCPSCSYDLTGNVSGVCPECGAKVGNAANA